MREGRSSSGAATQNTETKRAQLHKRIAGWLLRTSKCMHTHEYVLNRTKDTGAITQSGEASSTGMLLYGSHLVEEPRLKHIVTQTASLPQHKIQEAALVTTRRLRCSYVLWCTC